MGEIDEARVTGFFFELYEALPRCGPGTDAATARALEQAELRSTTPRVLDLGCGPGPQTLALAALLPSAEIVAVDLHRPFLDTLTAALDRRGLRHRVHPINADMGALGVAEGVWDLVWSEGAAYSIGFSDALTRWRPLLAEGGVLAVTEATWLRSDPPIEAQRWWQAEYPAIQDVAGNLALFASHGYRVDTHFPLPRQAWWDNYYLPMERRLHRIAAEHHGDAAAAVVIATAREEIEMYRRHGSSYGYTFFVGRPS